MLSASGYPLGLIFFGIHGRVKPFARSSVVAVVLFFQDENPLIIYVFFTVGS